MLEIHTGLLFHGLEAVVADADGSREFGGRCGVTHLPLNILPASGPGVGGGWEISSTSSLVGSSCCQRRGWLRRQRCWGRPGSGCHRRGCSTKRIQAQANGLVADLDVSNLGRETEGMRHAGFWKNLPQREQGNPEETQNQAAKSSKHATAASPPWQRRWLRGEQGAGRACGTQWGTGRVLGRTGHGVGWQRVAALL